MHEATKQTLPMALVVGPMKCGTSWIHDYLALRGDVCLPHLVKETFYFDRYPDRGRDWYAARFAQFDPAQHKGIMEVAPSYFHRSDDVPDLIRSELGDIPILITLRDPVERVWSHYQHMRRGYTRAPIEEAVITFPEILDASRYDHHLPRWQACFSRVSVVEQSLLASDPEAYAKSVSEALGLEPFWSGDLEHLRSNEATEPASFAVANAGRRLSNGLRKAGLYNVVDLAKRLGLKALFFGKPTRRNTSPNAEDLQWIVAALKRSKP